MIHGPEKQGIVTTVRRQACTANGDDPWVSRGPRGPRGLPRVTQGSEKGLDGVLADVRVIVGKFAELKGAADGEDYGVDQAAGSRRVDQALCDHGLVQRVTLLDAQIGRVALRLGELLGEAGRCATESNAGMACCNGAPQGVEAAPTRGSEEQDRLGSGHGLECLSDCTSCEACRYKS